MAYKMTQADRDAGLTEEDVALGMRGKVIKGGSDAAMRAKMNAEKYDSPSIVDQYRDFKKNPSAKAFPVADRTKIKESAPEIVPLETPRRTSNDEIGDLIKRLGSGRVGTTPSSFAEPIGAKRGGSVNKMAKKKSTSSASRRADGIATKGKTKGRMV
jgi:hypothetical protein